ncbi:MAG: VOC family protein [Steroidobacteraceae bacterium]
MGAGSQPSWQRTHAQLFGCRRGRALGPKSIDGLDTQTVHLQLNKDVDAHCERARKAGAVIQMEPTTQFYGDRTYRAVDPEGHIWSFAQSVKQMTSDEWDKAMSVKTKTRL